MLNSEIIAIDIETTGLNPRKDEIIGFSISDGKTSEYIAHKHWLLNEFYIHTQFDKCVEILNSLKSKKLVTANGQFDLTFIKNFFGVELLDYLYADVQLMAHLHDENLMTYALKPLVKHYLGIESDEQIVLKTEMKALGIKDFYKVSFDTMKKYAANDALITAKLYYHLKDKINDELFQTEIMPLYRTVVIPMTRYGIKVDLPKLKSDQIEIATDLERLEAKIQNQISPYLLPFKDWFYEKTYPIKSRGKMAALMKWNPMASKRSVQMLAFKQDGGTYEFNIQSKDHLKILFFDTLKETPLSYTDGGKPQVDSDFLSSMTKWPFAKELVLYNKLLKIKSTYIDRFIDEQENGVFYPSYFMHRTVSGRLSSDFQQLPRPMESGDPLILKYNNNLRAYFIARDNHVFIDDDYNSLEPRVFASVAGDQALIEIFANDEDFYSKIAIMVEGHNASPLKSADNYLGKINKEARQTAKAYSLGIAYGLDDYKLHKDLNISQDLAKRLVNGYFSAFPKLAEWQKKTREQILTQGHVATRLGRRRNQLHIPELYKKHGDAILNALELWKKYMANEPNEVRYRAAKKDYKEVRHAINNAYNHQIQGLAAHIMNRAAINIAKEFKSNNINAIIVAQIHDELVIESSEEHKHMAAKIVKDCMENSTKIEVELIAEPSFGYNLKDAKG